MFGRDTSGWWARDPARRARAVRAAAPARMPALFIDVGASDPFAPHSRAFHDSLAAAGVPHRYAVRPGGHDWGYWRARVGESLAWLLRETSR